MAYINENYLKLKAGYIFPEIGRRVKTFAAQNPTAKIIRMGIGDVTEPLPMACIHAMHKAVDEMATHEGFHGYGPEQGYDWLRNAAAKYDYQDRNCDIAPDEIFVSDGSKCDCANILDIFAAGGANNGGNIIAMTDPVYPVYIDSNVMHGNTGLADQRGEYSGLLYLRATAQNNFTPDLPNQKVDIIYLCYPNNPTGSVITRDRLTQWVNFAKENRAVIMYDAAYEAYISDPALPRSIYEIPGAREVAIEFRSFSKTAGFTGTRCAYTTVPKSLLGYTHPSKPGPSGPRVDSTVPLHPLWLRRHTTKFNSVPYIIQRGALATFTPEGQSQIRDLINFYMTNAKLLRSSLSQAGLTCFGGEHAPYVWIKTPNNLSSWQFFDQLLHDSHIVSTPGLGFGSSGEGYIRLSAFNTRANVEEAVRRITTNSR